MEQSRDIYAQLARIGKVVMHPKRIELLEMLCQGERSVEALAIAADLKLTTVSAHLQVMRQARLVTTRREGLRVYYCAAGDEVCRFVVALADLARARLAEVEQILRAVAGGEVAERVTRTQLLDRARAGDVVVIDVRPTEEFAAGHIPEALSVPLGHLEARLADLDPRVEVVAYCRGPLCLLAPQATATLRALGYRASCLEDGMPEWRQAGLPVATGPEASTSRRRRRPGGISQRRTTNPSTPSTPSIVKRSSR